MDLTSIVITAAVGTVFTTLSAIAGVLWKLSSRLTAVESTVKSLSEKCVTLDHDVSTIEEKFDDFKIDTIEHRHDMLERHVFSSHTEAQEKKWIELWRMVGNIEGKVKDILRVNGNGRDVKSISSKR